MTVTTKKLTNEELIILAKNGDVLAKEQLFKQNQPLIRKLVMRYQNVADAEDLMSIGNLGLLKAYNSYTPTKGIKFTSYFTRVVTNEVLMYFRRTKRYKNESSYEETLYEDDGGKITYFDTFEEENAQLPFLSYETNEIVKQVLHKFYANEKPKVIQVFELKLIKGMRQQDIAKEMGVSQAQVSRYEKIVRESLAYYYKKIL